MFERRRYASTSANVSTVIAPFAWYAVKVSRAKQYEQLRLHADVMETFGKLVFQIWP
jgi:hypothetical protein